MNLVGGASDKNAANRHVLWPGKEPEAAGHPAQIPQADGQFDSRGAARSLCRRMPSSTQGPRTTSTSRWSRPPIATRGGADVNRRDRRPAALFGGRGLALDRRVLHALQATRGLLCQTLAGRAGHSRFTSFLRRWPFRTCGHRPPAGRPGSPRWGQGARCEDHRPVRRI